MLNRIVRRIFVEKKDGFDVEAQALKSDLTDNLGIAGIISLRILNRYDVQGLAQDEYERALRTIFSEPPVDIVYEESYEAYPGSRIISVEYLPGQYDQRADSASQCAQILTCGERPEVKSAKIIIIGGSLTDNDFEKIKNYCINPVESREASAIKPDTLETPVIQPPDVRIAEGFISMTDDELSIFISDMGFAMSNSDLELCRDYFADVEKREPTLTELRVIDTYWSDHCRHTTFLTEIDEISIEQGHFKGLFNKTLKNYLSSRISVHDKNINSKNMSLMDLATIAMKELKMKGCLDDLDASDEINACSIVADADVGGKSEKWLVMFKNETHNHPTEIEPFGGAATCLGGAIRDPLSGRAYVYQAMRVTGSGDPRTKVSDTLPGKLPQRKITTGAASGYSSYGNQIGLATGLVEETYNEGFVAKRMEIGAVIGAVPAKNVIRQKPSQGDAVILLGGRTGRDGCGGATGSSKEHDEDSLSSCGAEVQKGNPPTERKIQRLFRNPEVSRMIKKCNDFGAGGVSVAIGELSDGIKIDLDSIPKKYEGLDGTELAISESQERMAVVVADNDKDKFLASASGENLEAVQVAVVTSDRRLVMEWRGKTIVDISRDFLDTNGAKQYSHVTISDPDSEKSFFKNQPLKEKTKDINISSMWLERMNKLDTCCQKGLSERFDSSIGAATVFMPFGGKYQLSPQEFMAAKLPVQEGDTKTCTVMSYGYNPEIGIWSPFHGSVYAIVEAIAKIAASGCDYRKTRMSFQEYFEKLGKDPLKWGKPFAALLGAYYTQLKLGIPSIGGKDSMSGTFKDISVPPTLVAFAVNVGNAGNLVSSEFKSSGNKVYLLEIKRDKYDLPDFNHLENAYCELHNLIAEGKALSSRTIRSGGIAEAISKMCFGNMIGFKFKNRVSADLLFEPLYGSIIIETGATDVMPACFTELGMTIEQRSVNINRKKISLVEILKCWGEPLDGIFQSEALHGLIKGTIDPYSGADPEILVKCDTKISNPSILKHIIPKPKVLIPVFPGNNCEYDTARKFEEAGGIVETFIFKNLDGEDVEHSIKAMAEKITEANIIAIPGGFSGGDEPDGSGKFIATAFRNPYITNAVTELLEKRDGLIIGICNGFQALIKLGLLPYGKITDMTASSPTLTYNSIGRHISRMVTVRVVSSTSPWLANTKCGNLYVLPVSHGEGRFIAGKAETDILFARGQVATVYADIYGNTAEDVVYNPNGSILAVEGITSPDGRIFGKMCHNERITSNVARNVPGCKDQGIFKAGVSYFM